MRIERWKLRTIIAAAEMAPGVMLFSSSRVARGRGPERRARPVFPTDVGPRKMARRIFWKITERSWDDKYMGLHSRSLGFQIEVSWCRSPRTESGGRWRIYPLGRWGFGGAQ